MGELIFLKVGEQGTREVARQQLAERPRRFVLYPARAYLHVGEYLSNGQVTARWSKRLKDGVWFMQGGWKRPDTRARLSAAQAADVERLIEGAPTEREELERLVKLIGRMREEDREFITPSTVAEFGGVCTIRAREALRVVFGEGWLARQDAASAG